MTTLTPPPTDAAVIDLIKQIPSDDYPPELFAARRAGFIDALHLHNADPRALAVATGVIEPGDCDVETPPVSEWQDERNSRP
jgi:hypothetical protein